MPKITQECTVEQLRKDMEAGTQGDWWADPRSTEIIVSSGPHTKYVVADVEDIDDARRIARVPQLERIALAAEELYVATLNYQAHKLGTVLKLGKAQDKYREATK